jgi:alpha-mannosidase
MLLCKKIMKILILAIVALAIIMGSAFFLDTQLISNDNDTSPKELKIISEEQLEKIAEGENIKFDAVLVLSNGSEKVVTSEVEWQILGGIGTISKDGAFTSKLDISVLEFRSAFGNVIGIWKDQVTSKEFLGKTAIFKVDAKPQ